METTKDVIGSSCGNSTATTMTNIENKPSHHDQFKATKMWNEVLHAFYAGIELKKHRKQMKLYYDCFTTSEAVTWLKNYLKDKSYNENKITRIQALNLLKKYHRSNIVERINADKNDLELKDNSDLLRFTVDANENLPTFIRTSKSEEELLKSCSQKEEETYETIDLNIREKTDIYQKVFWSHLNRLLYNVDEYVQQNKINQMALFNNVTKVNSNGVVQLIDKNEDLPHWILSAMKCLANWPKASGSGNCLPKYPGFEYDVFLLIREYFTNMEEPIIGYEFYRLFIDVHELYVKSLSTSREKPTPILTFQNHSSRELGLPPNCVYETVFSSKDPVTKIVPIDELASVCPSLVEYFKQTTLNESNVSNRNLVGEFSPLSTSNTFRALSTIPRNCSRKKSKENSTPYNSNSTTPIVIESPPESGEYMLNKHVSGGKFCSLRKNKISDSHQIEPMSLKNQYYELIQLLLLLLPNANRRHLQLLIRLFHKIIGNKELCLLTKDSIVLKEHIVTIFTRCIICAEHEKDFSEFKAKEFVSFLIDECMEIFKVPQDFLADVEKMMIDSKRKKSQENTAENYCRKISNEEYESQRDALSDAALSDLLQSIMRDDSLSERDKLKWIKQFKMYHPDVYDVYLTNCNDHQYAAKNDRPQQQRAYSLGSQRIMSMKRKRDLFKRFLSLKI